MAAYNIFAQAPTKKQEFPAGTVGNGYVWKLNPTGETPGDAVSSTQPGPAVNFVVDVPTDASYTYEVTCQRLDEAGNGIGGSLAEPFTVPPKLPGVSLDVVDGTGRIAVEITGAE